MAADSKSASAPAPKAVAAAVVAPTRNADLRIAIGIKHFHQLHHWDCGVACSFMFCRYIGLQQQRTASAASTAASAPVSYDALKEAVEVSSVWTIDLCYMLYRLGVRGITYHTITVGVDPGFAGQSFYANHISNDTKRVNSLFARAETKKDIIVQKRSLSSHEFAALFPLPPPQTTLITLPAPPPPPPGAVTSVAGSGAAATSATPPAPYVAIVLLDRTHMHCPLCQSSSLLSYITGSTTHASAPAATPSVAAPLTAGAPTAGAAANTPAITVNAPMSDIANPVTAATAAPAIAVAPTNQPSTANALAAAPLPPPHANGQTSATAAGSSSSGGGGFFSMLQSCLGVGSNSSPANTTAATAAAPSAGNYVGHYVLVIGRTPMGDYIYLDPNVDADYCLISEADMERARKSYGTDEDLIIFDLRVATVTNTHTTAAGGSSSERKHSFSGRGAAAGPNGKGGSGTAPPPHASARRSGTANSAGGGSNRPAFGSNPAAKRSSSFTADRTAAKRVTTSAGGVRSVAPTKPRANGAVRRTQSFRSPASTSASSSSSSTPAAVVAAAAKPTRSPATSLPPIRGNGGSRNGTVAAAAAFSGSILGVGYTTSV